MRLVLFLLFYSGECCFMGTPATSKYLDELPSVEKEQYIRKLKFLHGGPGVDKYDKIKEEFWIDDVSTWHPVEFSALYMYFIETPGGYTHE